MDYPATQMFVNDDDEEQDIEEESSEDAETPLRAEKNVKIGVLLVDSITYPVLKGVNRIGRIDSCSIVIDHNTVSKEHAEIEAGIGSKSTFISDLGSMNKTKLNDAILRPGRLYQLQDGDVVRFGSIKAVFKMEEKKVEKSFVRSMDRDDFVIPETPAPIRKEIHSVIPGTPDLSFDKSLTDGSRSSDVSFVAGTQDVGIFGGRSSPHLSKEPLSLRESAVGVKPDANRVHNLGIDNRNDISELETQKNISTDDSDEDNIFDMMTQQSDIHNDETQKFSFANNVSTVEAPRSDVDKIEPHSHSIEDLETQKFSNDDDRIDSRSYSISDLETQKFPLGDVSHSSRCTSNGIESHSISINDLETQKFDVDGVKDIQIQSHSRSINDVETQKPEDVNRDDEDSETDEEGIFANIGDDIIDMFEAPTQLVRKVNEEKRASLNDSVESKLNHMFDDVNESAVEEPTQILTQHLEKMLESTQIDESEVHQRVTDMKNTENAEPQLSTSANDKEGDDNDNTTKKTNESVKNRSRTTSPTNIQVPHILSTQELFEDLPLVNIFRTSSSNSKIQSKDQKRAGSTDSVESVDSKRLKRKKSMEPKVAESRSKPIEKNQTPSKSNGRKKQRIQEELVPHISSAENIEETNPKIDEPMKTENRKGLPLKKRGSSIISDPQTPRKMAPETVAPNARTLMRSNVKIIAVEAGKRSTRSSVIDSPKILESKIPPSNLIKVNHKPESPTSVLPAETEPLNRTKKGTRSKKGDNASSSTNTTLNTEARFQPISSPRRAGKKPLDSSASVSDEAVTPVKRPRTIAAALPSAVNNRPRRAAQRGKGKNVTPRELNVSEPSDLPIDQSKSPSTRRQRARSAAKTPLTDDGNLSTKPSLESQEIQAILGVVDQGDKEVPHHCREMRFSRSYVAGNDFKRNENFMGFPKTDRLKEDNEDRFEKPIGVPERKKRQLRRPQPDARDNNDEDDDEDLTEPSKKRSKPRGHKNTDFKQDNLSKGEFSSTTNAVTVAVGSVGSLKLKSHSKSLTETGKIMTEKIKAQDSPAPVIVAQKSTPKRRTTIPANNKRGVSQRIVDGAGKGNVVEETVAKRGRKKAIEAKSGKANATVLSDDEVKVSQHSSPLRRGRSSVPTPASSASSSAEIKHKILFTGLNNSHLVSIVHNLGGTITEKPNDCTALVTDKVRRTYKFLCSMAMAIPIVSVEWLEESERKGKFLHTGDFLLKDPAEEAKFKFNLRHSLAKATDDKLLEGYTLVLTPNTAPPPNAEMKSIIQACGGKALARPPTSWPEKSLIISRQEDVKNAKKYLTKAPRSVRILSVEFILTGILRHELNFEEHKLEVN